MSESAFMISSISVSDVKFFSMLNVSRTSSDFDETWS